MSELVRDLRFGVRLLAKSPVFTATAALLLAVGISANTLIFSVVNALLLRPLPVPDSERIVLMGNAYPGAGAAAAGGGNSGVPDYYDRLRETDVFEEQADRYALPRLVLAHQRHFQTCIHFSQIFADDFLIDFGAGANP